MGVGWGEMVEANLFFEGCFKGGEVGAAGQGRKALVAQSSASDSKGLGRNRRKTVGSRGVGGGGAQKVRWDGASRSRYFFGAFLLGNRRGVWRRKKGAILSKDHRKRRSGR